MANYSQLCKEQRNNIEHLLNKGFSFTYIANSINVDRTTISKEIRRNRILTNSCFLPFSKKGINQTVSRCNKLSKPPYCCNNCKEKSFCLKSHLFYNAKQAQKHYEEILIQSRTGVDITLEEVAIINKNIVPLIKNKKQSVNQVYINHSDILCMSKPTFYKYVNTGVLNLTNLDLSRKVKYKKRKLKSNKQNKRDIALLEGRTYEDYLNRISNDKKANIWQLDTVIGKRNENKCLMTFLLVETNLMIIKLLEKKDVLHVDDEFTNIKNSLGNELYKKYIPIILTDNGIEFYDPIHLEIDLNTGEKLSSVYYCHPNSPEEKPELEKNHEYIRYYLPKSSSFKNLTTKQVKTMENNINNIPREILGNQTPYELTKKLYPELIKKLDIKYIKPDEVTLNPEDMFGGENNDR